MTLPAIAQRILEAAQTGQEVDAEALIRELSASVGTQHSVEDLLTAITTLDRARAVAYTHRAQVVQSLRELEKSTLYSEIPDGGRTSWNLSG